VDHAPRPQDLAPPPGEPAAPPPGELGALRAEHDVLLEQVSTRASVDRMKEGGVLAFFTVICLGMSSKLAWDRWGWLPANKPRPEGEYPLFFLVGAALTLVLLRLAVRRFVAARALRREEAALFARLRALRARLGLDP
jgi:hypothetical protein